MKPLCQRCIFSEMTPSPSNLVGERVRVCRLLPPTTQAVPVGGQLVQLTSWPTVQPNDWCGHFAPAGTVPASLLTDKKED